MQISPIIYNNTSFRGSHLILSDRHTEHKPTSKDHPEKQRAWNRIMSDAHTYRNADEALDAYFKWEIEYKNQIQQRYGVIPSKKAPAPVQEEEPVKKPIGLKKKPKSGPPTKKAGYSCYQSLNGHSAVISHYKKSNPDCHNNLPSAVLEWHEDERKIDKGSDNWTKIYYNTANSPDQVILEASRHNDKPYCAIIDIETGDVRTNLDERGLIRLKGYATDALHSAKKARVKLPFDNMQSAVEKII